MVRPSPPADVGVTVDLVRSLLADQLPDLATLGLRHVNSGWDNAVFRLGDDLAVRVPRRQAAAVLVEHEQRWLPELAPRLPLAVPTPVRVGRPGRGYPWSWSVIPWFAGEPAADVTFRSPAADAVALGEFVAALHTPAPPDAPPNAVRGGPLAELTERVEANLAALEDAASPIDVARCRRRWAQLASTSEWHGPPMWLHGDLHAANVLVADGRVNAVIDFGDVTSGDPATDLAIAWMLFDEPDRQRFRVASGVDPATWLRGSAWALHYAAVFLLHSAGNPRFERIATRTFRSLGL